MDAAIQLALATFGLTALWMATGNHPKARRWACVVGLAGQPLWLFASWQAEQMGMFLVSIAYTIVWGRAAWEMKPWT